MKNLKKEKKKNETKLNYEHLGKSENCKFWFKKKRTFEILNDSDEIINLQSAIKNLKKNTSREEANVDK